MLTSSETQMDTRTHAARLTMPGVLLRLEGLAALIASIVLYVDQGWNGLVFILLLWPQTSPCSVTWSMRGWRACNSVHVYALPLALLRAHSGRSAAECRSRRSGSAHRHGPRARLRLKYETGFKDTHLQQV
jgi:hypothetical protein